MAGMGRMGKWTTSAGKEGQGPGPCGGPDKDRGRGQRWRSGGRDCEKAETRARDGGGSVGAGPGAPIPRLLVITCPEEAAGS